MLGMNSPGINTAIQKKYVHLQFMYTNNRFCGDSQQIKFVIRFNVTLAGKYSLAEQNFLLFDHFVHENE